MVRIKRITSTILLIIIFSTCIYAINQIFISASTETIDEEPKVKLNGSTFTITMWNKKASDNYYRWRTIGWIVTTQPLEGSGTTLEKMSDFKKKADAEARKEPDINKRTYAYAEFSYNVPYGTNGVSCTKTDIDEKTITVNGEEITYIQTLYEFDTSYVQSQLSNINWEILTQTKTLYLHAVFETYTGDGANESVDKTPIYDVAEIRNHPFSSGIKWSYESTKNGFYKYVNLPVTYEPEPQAIKVFYHYDFIDNSKDVDVEITDARTALLIGATYNRTIQKETTYKDSNFEYQDYDIMTRGSDLNYYKDSSYKDSKTHLGSAGTNYSLDAIVPYGGLKIYVYYKEVKKPEPQPVYIRRIYAEYSGTDSSLSFQEKKKLQKKTLMRSLIPQLCWGE